MTISVDSLPDETLLAIFAYLGSHCYYNVSHVCARWRSLARTRTVLAKHIETQLCESEHEKRFLTGILSRHDKLLDTLYLYVLQRKLVAMELYLKYRIDCGQMTRMHPYYECSTFSADGRLYVVVFRNHHILPAPIRTIHFYSITLMGARLLRSFALKDDADRPATKVVLARDARSLALAVDTGYVEVYSLASASAKLACCDRIFSMQHPSTIHSLAVSSNAELLAMGCHRLGGLTLVDLRTRKELGVPHYRLDLSMDLQTRDQALLLRGWNETIVIRSFSEESWQEKESIWEYFEEIIKRTESTYVQLENAVCLDTRQYFVGIKPISHHDTSVHQLRLVYMPEDYDEDDVTSADVHDPDEEGIQASKILLDLQPASLYKFVLSDDTSRLLVTQDDTVRIFPLSTGFLKLIANCEPVRESFDSSPTELCLNYLVQEEFKCRLDPLMSRQFPIDLWHKPIRDIKFIDHDGVVVEYDDEIAVYELSPTPVQPYGFRMDVAGQIIDSE